MSARRSLFPLHNRKAIVLLRPLLSCYPRPGALPVWWCCRTRKSHSLLQRDSHQPQPVLMQEQPGPSGLENKEYFYDIFYDTSPYFTFHVWSDLEHKPLFFALYSPPPFTRFQGLCGAENVSTEISSSPRSASRDKIPRSSAWSRTVPFRTDCPSAWVILNPPNQSDQSRSRCPLITISI